MSADVQYVAMSLEHEQGNGAFILGTDGSAFVSALSLGYNCAAHLYNAGCEVHRFNGSKQIYFNAERVKQEFPDTRADIEKHLATLRLRAAEVTQ